jgi:hypothetical protein
VRRDSEFAALNGLNSKIARRRNVFIDGDGAVVPEFVRRRHIRVVMADSQNECVRPKEPVLKDIRHELPQLVRHMLDRSCGVVTIFRHAVEASEADRS